MNFQDNISQKSNEETELQKFSNRGKEFNGLLNTASYLSARNRWDESKEKMNKAKEILLIFEADRTTPKKIYDAAKQRLYDTERRIKGIGVLIAS